MADVCVLYFFLNKYLLFGKLSWLMKDIIKIIRACVVIVVVVSVAYHSFHPEWVSYRHGERCFDRAQYLEAAKNYQNAIDNGLNEPQVFLRLAEAQLFLGQTNQAVETAKTFRSFRTHTPETLYFLSELFITHGMFEDATRILVSLVAENPENRQARFRLAQILTWTQQFDKAIEHYEQLLGGKL